MNLQLKRSAIVALSLVSACLGLSSSAHAANHPMLGAACQNSDFDSNDEVFRDDGFVQNFDTANTASVYCPMVESSFTDDPEWQAKVGFGSTLDDLFCVAEAFAADGTIQGFDSDSEVPDRGNVLTLSGDFDLGNDVPPDTFVYGLLCNLPRNGGTLLSYRIDD